MPDDVSELVRGLVQIQQVGCAILFVNHQNTCVLVGLMHMVVLDTAFAFADGTWLSMPCPQCLVCPAAPFVRLLCSLLHKAFSVLHHLMFQNYQRVGAHAYHGLNSIVVVLLLVSLFLLLCCP